MTDILAEAIRAAFPLCVAQQCAPDSWPCDCRKNDIAVLAALKSAYPRDPTQEMKQFIREILFERLRRLDDGDVVAIYRANLLWEALYGTSPSETT